MIILHFQDGSTHQVMEERDIILAKHRAARDAVIDLAAEMGIWMYKTDFEAQRDGRYTYNGEDPLEWLKAVTHGTELGKSPFLPDCYCIFD